MGRWDNRNRRTKQDLLANLIPIFFSMLSDEHLALRRGNRFSICYLVCFGPWVYPSAGRIANRAYVTQLPKKD